jgi:hypothetical protein
MDFFCLALFFNAALCVFFHASAEAGNLYSDNGARCVLCVAPRVVAKWWHGPFL